MTRRLVELPVKGNRAKEVQIKGFSFLANLSDVCIQRHIYGAFFFFNSLNKYSIHFERTGFWSRAGEGGGGGAGGTHPALW